MNDYINLIASFQEEMIASLQGLIRIKSVSGQERETLQALEYYLDLGRRMGFKAENVQNLGGVIDYGEGEKTIGIIVHLDVVPEGSGWQHPPFEGQIEDGKIYGRGAIDDKGPAISALYALKAVKESGSKPPCRIRLIIGLDEETIWHKTPKLLNKIQNPDFSFVPDSKFPLVIAEKGLIWLELKKRLTEKVSAKSSTMKPKVEIKPEKKPEMKSEIIIKKLSAGGSLNIVPDYCEVLLDVKNSAPAEIEEKLKSFTQERGFRLELKAGNREIKLISRGKSAHAFNCNEGQNAISQLVLFLKELNVQENQKRFLATYGEKIGLDCYGESLGLACEDDLTGKLTVSPGFLEMDEESFTLRLDIRFPAQEKLDTMLKKVNSAFACFEAEQKILDSLESLSFAESDPHIQTLLKVYREYTGDREAKPLGMGGTTFAKAFRNAVAFGPTFPGMPKVEHQPDEYMEIEHLMRCTELYALAISELIKLSS